MTIRIGVLGAARIVPDALVGPAADIDGVEVAVIAARDPERAKAFADEHGIPRVASDYQSVVDDPDIDAVFNPLPNSLHAPWTIAALRAGKHVLCEKPFSLNAAEAEAMVAAAETAGKVLVEAFHWRYHPLADRIRALAGPDHIGELRHVAAEFSVPILDTTDIRYDLGLGGGALMDLGAYTVQWVRFVAGSEPEVVAATAEESPAAPGIDITTTAELRWPSGVTGTIRCSMQPPEGGVAIRLDAIGDRARLEVSNPLTPHHGHRIRLLPPEGGEPTLVETVEGRTTYHHQLEAFVAAVSDGVPAPTGGADAIASMRVIDAIYAKAGLPPRG